MASKSKKQETPKQGKVNLPQNANTNCKGEHSNKMELITIVISIITIVISVMALAVSIYTAYSSTNYAEAEYSYKLDPKIEVYGNIGVQKFSNEPGAFQVVMDKFHVAITEKNNLERAYLVYPSYRVEGLTLDNMENILQGKMENGQTSSPDINTGKYQYRYFFVYLESLDDNGELYLIYTKVFPSSPESKIIQSNCVSGIEVFGLGNEWHENSEEYEGEKIMAAEYVRILEDLPKYIPQ